MFFLFKPSNKKINKIIALQSSRLPFSYNETGATKDRNAPKSYPINYFRKELDKSRETYKIAMGALCSWQMYALDWTQVFPSNVPIKKGEIVAVLANHLGIWSLNPCRIVYVIDEENEQFQRFGFAIGTLPAHSEKGEEQFLIERNKETDAIFYKLHAFAKPENWLAKIGSPFVSYIQKRFAAESYEAIRKAVVQGQK